MQLHIAARFVLSVPILAPFPARQPPMLQSGHHEHSQPQLHHQNGRCTVPKLRFERLVVEHPHSRQKPYAAPKGRQPKQGSLTDAPLSPARPVLICPAEHKVQQVDCQKVNHEQIRDCHCEKLLSRSKTCFFMIPFARFLVKLARNGTDRQNALCALHISSAYSCFLRFFEKSQKIWNKVLTNHPKFSIISKHQVRHGKMAELV